MTLEEMTLTKVREEAKKKLMGVCGVYKICDGDAMRICQGQSYGRPLGFGGIGSGASFNNNVLALKKLSPSSLCLFLSSGIQYF